MTGCRKRDDASECDGWSVAMRGMMRLRARDVPLAENRRFFQKAAKNVCWAEVGFLRHAWQNPGKMQILFLFGKQYLEGFVKIIHKNEGRGEKRIFAVKHNAQMA